MNLKNQKSHIQKIESYIEIRKKDYYENIYKFFKEKKISSVIDVGGATGDFAFHGPENIKFLSTDISKDLIKIAKETRSKKNINFMVDDILKTSIKEKFEAVLMLGTLATISNLSAVLKELCNLSSKYILIHSCINRYEFDTLISHKRSSESNENYRIFNIFSFKSLETELMINNFKVIKLEKFKMKNTLKQVDSPTRLTNYHVDINGEKSLINQIGLILDEYLIIAKKN